MMRVLTGTLTLSAALLYGAATLAGNTSPSMLDEGERATVEELIPFDMDGFVLHDEPRPFRGKTFFDPKGKEIDLSEFEGKVTVLNFWATWCPPCRKELPYFDELQAELGDEGLRVVTISLDKNAKKAAPYLEDKKLTNLEAFTDSKANLSREMGVLGLPVTAILGPDAREIGRLTGEAEWHSDEAKEWLRAIIEATSDEST